MMRKIYSSLQTAWWKGAFTGVPVIILFFAILIGISFKSGLPVIVIILISIVASSILLCVLAFIAWLIKKLFSRVPVAVTVAFVATLGVLTAINTLTRFPDLIFYGICIVLIVIAAVFSGNIALLIKSHYKLLSHNLKITIAISFILGCTFLTWLIVWLASNGNVEINTWERPFGNILSAPLSSENPAATGKYAVGKFTYGSGTDKKRREYGKEANLITKSVDASVLLPEWDGFKKKMREWYWGFGVKEFPLNGRVWYPEGDGTFPLVLIVHGNHGMEEYSDPGYAYLGELLASKGYITVSVDENFLNGTWSGDFVGKEMQTRGWLLLQHLAVWRKWNQTAGHRFFNKVNMNQIALIGHSRGGEAVAIAAAFNTLPCYPDNASLKFDFNFKIRSLVAIAPTDRRYTRRMKLNDINYLTLQGGYDSDEPAFFGMRQAQRITYSNDAYFFNAGLYVPGANHGQFNSVWKQDSGPPFSWLLNVKPLIPEKDQQEIAKVYIAAFLDATLDGKKEYVSVFKNWANARTWLPAGSNYLSRFEDNLFIPVAGFEEDIDLTTATAKASLISAHSLNVWREAELFYRDGKDKQGNSAVVIGWRKSDDKKDAPSYTVELPADFVTSNSITKDDFLALSVSAGDPSELKKGKKEAEKKEKEQEKELMPDFSIVLIDSLGNEASVEAVAIIQLQPRWKIQYLKLKDESIEQFGDLWDPTLASYQIALSYFSERFPQLRIPAIRKIEFRFDRAPFGVILLDKVGFEKNRADHVFGK